MKPLFYFCVIAIAAWYHFNLSGGEFSPPQKNNIQAIQDVQYTYEPLDIKNTDFSEFNQELNRTLHLTNELTEKVQSIESKL